MTNEEKLIQQSLAIRSFPIKPIVEIVDNFKLAEHDEVKKFKSSINEWLKPYVDLSDFEFQYATNGITESLNYWMWSETRRIKMRDGDYVWVDGHPTGEVMYLSNPSSFDGNFCEIPTDIPVILDLAYIVSTPIKKINIPDNVERVFFSMSKCFGLRNYRIGYYWNRKPDRWLQPLHENAKYYNYHSMELGEEIIKQIPIDLVYNTLQGYQKEICNELSLKPSDVVWLATSDDPKYSKFRRNYTNRLCVANLIKERYYAALQNR